MDGYDNGTANPLLDNSGRSSIRRKSRMRRQPRGYDDRIELSTRQQYQPPTVQPLNSEDVPLVESNPNVYASESHFATNTTLHSELHNAVLTQDNPAEDLAYSCCSHGLLCIQCVRTQEIGISENCGAFEEILGPGLHFGLWPIQRIATRLSLRVQQLDIVIETKTKDNGRPTFCT